MTEILVPSSIDGSPEPSLFQLPPGTGAAPLLVGLHTWSKDRHNQEANMLPLAKARGWALLLPEFRGPNLTSNPRGGEACGSSLARQDVVDAVEHVLALYPDRLDRGRVALLGGSGGGHMALLLAAHAPGLWRMVSAWCPISDLAAWAGQNKYYRPHIEHCLGGSPHSGDPRVQLAYRDRSPLEHVASALDTVVSLHHGKWDDSVPASQSIAFLHAALTCRPEAPLYVEVFNGGHEIRYEQAFAELAAAFEATGNRGERLTR